MNSRKEPAVSIPNTLRKALWLLVHQSPQSPEELADELGVSQSYLYNAANHNLDDEGFHAQLRWLIPLTRRTGNFVVLDFIEQQVGRVGVSVLDGARRSVGIGKVDRVSSDFLTVTEDLGKAAADLQQSLKDRKLTQPEAARCRKDLWALIQAAVKVYQELGTGES